MVEPAERYANAWSAATEDDGRCWRYITRPDTSQPARCPAPPAWAGRVRDGTGRWHQVRACDWHRNGLEQAEALARSRADGDAAQS